MLGAAGLFWLVYLLFICSIYKPRSHPRDTKAPKQRGVGDQAKTPVCDDELAWRIHRGFPTGQQSVLNWPAVHCSLCCLQHCQKDGRRHSLATLQTVTKPAFTRDSIQGWPTGSGISGETICFNQCRASAFLLWTHSPYIPPPAWAEALKGLVSCPGFTYTFTSAPPMYPGLPWMSCWWYVGLLTDHRGEAGRMEPNICGLGATEGQPQGCGF